MTVNLRPPRTAPFWVFEVTIFAVALVGIGICGALGGPFGAVLASLYASWYVASGYLVHFCLRGRRRTRRGLAGWALILSIHLPIASVLFPLLTALSVDLHAEVFLDAWPPILCAEAAADLVALITLAIVAKRTPSTETVEQQESDGPTLTEVTP